MRIIVAGSRTFRDYQLLSDSIDKFILSHQDCTEVVIVSGTAMGADRLGEIVRFT
jgi:hypothetical protein